MKKIEVLIGPNELEFCRSYIQNYYYASGFRGLYSANSNTIGIGFDRRDVTISEYNSLYEKYHDFGFDDYLLFASTSALANEITGIDITSDADFDASHPAGASLNDVVMFCGASAR